MRQGLRASLVNGNSMYRFRAMVTYASGYQDNGWSYAFSVSTRQGGNSYVNGVYYNAFGYFAAVEKQFGQRHRLALTLLGAPTERGAQQAATRKLTIWSGNNYYKPHWGLADGKKRNARVRNNHEPVVMLNYTFDISDRSKLDLATSLRFGMNGYSALTWQNGPDPRPDYYRYLPSYFALDKNMLGAAWQQVYWQANYQNIRHFDWDKMYQTNYIQNDPVDEAQYGPGRRSNYMVEERHTDQLDWNLVATSRISSAITPKSTGAFRCAGTVRSTIRRSKTCLAATIGPTSTNSPSATSVRTPSHIRTTSTITIATVMRTQPKSATNTAMTTMRTSSGRRHGLPIISMSAVWA